MKPEPESVEEMRKWVDEASYRDLLARVRFAPPGSPWFRNRAVSDYYFQEMAKKGRADPDAAIAASKELGWGNQSKGEKR